MSENTLPESLDDDPWIIPLHGPSVPLTDVPAAPVLEVPSTNEAAWESFGLSSEDIPTDLGFQPRLRKSA